ncbi:Wzz/FepE/Etk N-terminal domain-containing protein [Hasllibacter sp. MH4015]|uniref:GumC family protein n=1 Tax=Hasllibacter sp. MH4015 TaxID=2854029 RepID=UPI001CD59913|nr:Wzz/FepE/Etk N-terminal domain-containing protein [Hasllibacter sp. MH4015]
MSRADERSDTRSFDPPADIVAEIDLMALFSTLWRGKWWILLFAIIGVLCTGYYATRVAVPLYPATATVALEGGEQQVIGDIESIFAGGGTDTVAINTEIEVFRSRNLIGELVDDLNLTEVPEFASTELNLMGRLTAFLSGAEPRTPPESALRNIVIDRLSGLIRVTNVRQSLAFRISIETTDPNQSALIVNRLAELYIDNQIRRKLDDSTRAIEFLSERTTELEANVEMLEQDLAQRMEASDVIDADLLQAQNLQLRDLRARIDEARASIATDQSLLTLFEGVEGGAAMVDVAESAGDGRFSGIVQRFRAGRLNEDAAELAIQGIVDDVASDIRRSEAQLTSLERSAEELTDQISTQSDELIAMQQLEREADAARLLYQTFLTRLQEASVQRGLESADSRILSEAVPRPPSSPRVMFLLMVGGFLGAVLGAAIALVREMRFAGFRTSDEVQQYTRTPVLGSLPAMSTSDRRGVLKSLKDKPNSVFAEAVRNLRTSILMTNTEAEPQVILVTSSIPGEGKTTLSLALARYFATLEGKRTLLVEADVRRQTLRAYVNEEARNCVQLIDVVLGRKRLEEVDLFDEELGIEVLMGSGGDFNAADLFETRRFKELITRLRGHYHHIIIDSPPVLAVPDARVLTRYADIAIFAVRWGSTTRTQVRQGLEMLASVGHPADGAVLTQVDAKKMKSYGYSGQYGYDGYSSGYYSTD